MRDQDINDSFETFGICCTQKKKSVHPFDKCQHLDLNWNRRWRLVPDKVDMDALVRIAVHCIAARTGKFRCKGQTELNGRFNGKELLFSFLKQFAV
jgi:hypothetical protein